VKPLYSGRQLSYESDPHTAVFVILSDRLSSYAIQVEDESVIESGRQDSGGDFRNKPPHEFDFIGYLNSGKVDVSCRSTQVIGREQYASLKNEFTFLLRIDKAKQEAFERIQSKVFGSGTPFAPGLPLQGDECSPIDSGLAWLGNILPLSSAVGRSRC
jgi:hypothetical protein